MTLIEIATAELIKKGVPAERAKSFATELFIGFPLHVAEAYGRQKWIEGAAAQRQICSKSPLFEKSNLEIVKAISLEVGNAPAPDFRC